MNLSLWIAFVGGTISLATPCSAMVLPTFSAAAAGKRRNLVALSLIFGLGLLAVLIPIGLGAVTLGQLLSEYYRSITTLIGVILLILAVISIFGNHPQLNFFHKLLPQNQYSGITAIFSLGIVAGVSTTTCMGPVFGAIISFASLQSPITGILHILAYGLGILMPLLLFSVTFDRVGSKMFQNLRRKHFQFKGRDYAATDLLSGLILLIFAYIIIFQNGVLTNSINPISETLLDLQDNLLKNR